MFQIANPTVVRQNYGRAKWFCSFFQSKSLQKLLRIKLKYNMIKKFMLLLLGYFLIVSIHLFLTSKLVKAPNEKKLML